jgi:hypothetical protein
MLPILYFYRDRFSDTTIRWLNLSVMGRGWAMFFSLWVHDGWYPNTWRCWFADTDIGTRTIIVYQRSVCSRVQRVNLPLTASMPNAIRCVVIIIIIIFFLFFFINPLLCIVFSTTCITRTLLFILDFCTGREGGCHTLGLNSHWFHVPAAVSTIFAAFVNSVNVTQYSIRYGIYGCNICVRVLCSFSLASYLKPLIQRYVWVLVK